MVRLRSCYFCGTTEALAGYETLPDALRAEGADGQQVVLCGQCHRKLRSILDPFFAHLSGDSPTVAERDDGSVEAVRSLDADGTDPDQTDVTFDTMGASDGDDVPDDATEGSSVAVDAEGVKDADSEGMSDGEDGTGAVDDVPDSTAAGPADERAGDGTSPPAVDSDDETAADTSDSDPASEDAKPSLPPAYYKLLRFLRNRELPMPRGRAEALVSGAYDLSETEAADLVDLAIERGALVEADGQIDRS